MICFEAKSGERVLRYGFRGIVTAQPLWWSYRRKRWVEKLDGDAGSNTAPCRSYKAFLRHIRKHSELTDATLVSRYVGHDVHYTKDTNA